MSNWNRFISKSPVSADPARRRKTYKSSKYPKKATTNSLAGFDKLAPLYAEDVAALALGLLPFDIEASDDPATVEAYLRVRDRLRSEQLVGKIALPMLPTEALQWMEQSGYKPKALFTDKTATFCQGLGARQDVRASVKTKFNRDRQMLMDAAAAEFCSRNTRKPTKDEIAQAVCAKNPDMPREGLLRYTKVTW